MSQLQMFTSQKVSVLFDKLLKDACLARNEGIAPEVKLVVYNTSAQPILTVTTASNTQIYQVIVISGVLSPAHEASDVNIKVCKINADKYTEQRLSNTEKAILLYTVYRLFAKELLNVDMAKENIRCLSQLFQQQASDKFFGKINKALHKPVKVLGFTYEIPEPNSVYMYANYQAKCIGMQILNAAGQTDLIRITPTKIEIAHNYDQLCPEELLHIIRPKFTQDVNYQNTVAQLYQLLSTKYQLIRKAQEVKSCHLVGIIGELQERDFPKFIQQIQDENLIIQPKANKAYDLYKNGTLYCSLTNDRDSNMRSDYFTIREPSGKIILATPSWSHHKDYTKALEYQILQMLAKQCQNCTAINTMCLNKHIKGR